MTQASILARIAVVLLGFTVLGSAGAQSYPVKAVRIVVPYPPGGGADLLARMMAQKLIEKWGQTVIVENRSGATGIIGTDLVAKSPPDGYTVLMGAAGELALNFVIYNTIPYNPERDFAPVILLSISPLVLAVHPSLPVRNVTEFIALAKASPGQLTYASTGNGSPHHLAGEWIKLHAKIDIIHVPYKGGGPQIIDLIGGQIGSGILAIPVAAPYMKSGRIRAIAMIGGKRLSAFPEVPTLDESGLRGLDMSQWRGMLLPTGTPRDVITKLNAEFAEILKLQDVRARLTELGEEPVGGSPKQFGDFIRKEIAKYRTMVKETKIVIN